MMPTQIINMPQSIGQIPQNSSETGETSVSPPQQPREPSPSSFYIEPVTLSNLDINRKKFAASQKYAVRAIGQKLQLIQSQFEKEKIDSDQHKSKCREIEEAAEILAGVSDFDAEILEKIGLNSIPLACNRLNDGEYKAILDDLKVQLSSEHGVVAERERKNGNGRIAAGYRAHFENFRRRNASQP